MSFPKKIIKRRFALTEVANNIQPTKQIKSPSNEAVCGEEVEDSPTNSQSYTNSTASADILLAILNNVQELTNTVVQQNTAILEALAEQKVLTSILIRQEKCARVLSKTFPIITADGLKDIERKILPECREQYIATLKSIISGNLKKNIRQILGDQIISDFNIDGTHGKNSLKQYQEFYSVLKDAVEISFDDPEQELRKSIQNQKKRIFKNKN